MFFYFVSFILLLGPLVFVHEFGHFFFAKLFNVRVDTFSMGFGPKLFKKKWGETEYCLSVVPLGGYVKLYGQDPTEVVDPSTRNRSLSNLAAWKRFLVFVAGPLFNFLFAIFVFAVMMVLGEQHLSPMVARVVPGSQAFKAGFRSGDFVTAIDNQVLTRYDEVAKTISDSPNKVLKFRVRREKGASSVREISVTPQIAPGYSMYGEPTEIGEIDGFLGFGRYTVIGISNPKSTAAKVGLKTGDEIVSIAGQSVKSWESIEQVWDSALASGAKQVVLGVVPHAQNYWSPESRPAAAKKAEREVTLPAQSLSSLGIYSSELFVASLVANSPAQSAGVQVGDRLVRIDSRALSSFQELREQVQKAGESTGRFALVIERNGAMLNFDLEPTSNTTHDAAGNQTKQYLMGVFPLFVQAESEYFVERVLNPFTLTKESWFRAIDLSVKTVVSLKKLFFRQVSVGTLGGPLLIGKLAGDSMSRGASAFLKVMALISISLAIFNLLPVPILDGGHIFLLGIEVVRGRPISIRSTEFVQQVGLSLIVLLLVVVLFNDFSRVGLPALRQMFQ